MNSKIHLSTEDLAALHALRHRRHHDRHTARQHRTRGEVVSDWVATQVGSWRFIIIQSILMVVWLILNITAWIKAWDPYPFILLNLVLSFQAAYTAPIIMMSQNRQSDIDRERAKQDYDVNLKAELEIELLHQKIDAMKEQEIIALQNMMQKLIDKLDNR